MDYKGGILAIGTANYVEFWMPKDYYYDSDLDENAKFFEARFKTQFY